MKCPNCGTKNSKLMALTKAELYSAKFAPCKKCGKELVDTDRLIRIIFTIFILPILLIFALPKITEYYLGMSFWISMMVDALLVIPLIILSIPWKRA